MAPLVLPSGRAVPIELKRHARAKRFVLRVSGGVIQLTIPTRARKADGLAWARRQVAYVEKKLADEPAPVPFAVGAELPVLGDSLKVVPGLKVPGAIAGRSIEIAPAEPQRLAKRLEALLRARALEAAEEELHRYWRMLDVPPAPVSVRSYRRRWGACGADGSTALNWRLVFAPREVLSYVAAHEAAHRIEMNHSAAFWAVVQRIAPGFEAQERWLKEHGAELYAYGDGAV